MKSRINYTWVLPLVSLMAFFIPVSCNKDEKIKSTQSQLIKVSGEGADATTKTTLNNLATSWVAGTDMVGIYSDKARTAANGGGSIIANTQFTAAGNGVQSDFTGTMYWGEASSEHKFYAYYPYTAGSALATEVPVSLPAAQTQTENNSISHLAALDFLIATPLTVTSPANTDAVAGEVNLSYNHLFTIIEFQIKGSGSLKAVKLNTNTTLGFSGGSIDITQSKPATGVAYTFASQTGVSNEVKTTLTNPATLTSTNTDTKVYMVINPCVPTDNCLVGFSSDGTTWQYVTKSAPVNGFKRGVKYIVTIDAGSVEFSEVTSLTGKIWMDRNLGASQVATAANDINAYGYYYQWGRCTDGHQIITSLTSATLSGSDTPGPYFILSDSFVPFDWRSPQNNNLWQGVNGTNNPCPSGYRIPTNQEWEDEINTWTSGGFASVLKLPSAGYRTKSNGVLVQDNSGNYWSSTVAYMEYSYYLSIVSTSANTTADGFSRADGLSVRCIKNYIVD